MQRVESGFTDIHERQLVGIEKHRIAQHHEA
jgi:hypothetical protein